MNRTCAHTHTRAHAHTQPSTVCEHENGWNRFWYFLGINNSNSLHAAAECGVLFLDGWRAVSDTTG